MVEAGIRLAPTHIDQLRRACPDVVAPDDPGYDDARRLWNAIHDRRPAAIARPANAQEVAAAIAFGRARDLEITVQSGGHAATGAERERLWAAMQRLEPNLDSYSTYRSRQTEVIVFEPRAT